MSRQIFERLQTCGRFSIFHWHIGLVGFKRRNPVSIKAFWKISSSSRNLVRVFSMTSTVNWEELRLHRGGVRLWNTRGVLNKETVSGT